MWQFNDWLVLVQTLLFIAIFIKNIKLLHYSIVRVIFSFTMMAFIKHNQTDIVQWNIPFPKTIKKYLSNYNKHWTNVLKFIPFIFISSLLACFLNVFWCFITMNADKIRILNLKSSFAKFPKYVWIIVLYM